LQGFNIRGNRFQGLRPGLICFAAARLNMPGLEEAEQQNPGRKRLSHG